MENLENAFKIYKKGVGRKWFEEIVREYQGTKHYDEREIDLHFPTLPEDINEDAVKLVYGNRYRQSSSIDNLYCSTLSVEIYGENGVQVTDGDFIINGNIIVHRSGVNND